MNCPKCGASVDGDAKFCSACGSPLSENQSYESTVSDGISVSSVEVVPVTPTPTTKLDKRKIIPIVVILLLIILGAGIFLQKNKGPNFKKLYDEHCRSIWASVGSDGSYLTIDTNPFDEDDNGLAYVDAYKAVETINQELGCSESLFVDMGHTTGSDGKQTETYEDLGVTISWKYHPDRGLEVTYKKIK